METIVYALAGLLALPFIAFILIVVATRAPERLQLVRALVEICRSGPIYRIGVRLFRQETGPDQYGSAVVQRADMPTVDRPSTHDGNFPYEHDATVPPEHPP